MISTRMGLFYLGNPFRHPELMNCADACVHVYSAVPAIKTKKGKSEAVTGSGDFPALKAIKAKAAKAGKPLRKADLLKQGYSERFIAKFEAA
jgi:hypothetical protein